jgi:hypothetical protein
MLAERTVFADRAGISLQQLYAWNALLGESGEYCNTGFWGDTYYCVGVSGSTVVTTPKPSTSRSTETPGPTQTGIVSTFRTYLRPTMRNLLSIRVPSWHILGAALRLEQCIRQIRRKLHDKILGRDLLLCRCF